MTAAKLGGMEPIIVFRICFKFFAILFLSSRKWLLFIFLLGPLTSSIAISCSYILWLKIISILGPGLLLSSSNNFWFCLLEAQRRLGSPHLILINWMSFKTILINGLTSKYVYSSSLRFRSMSSSKRCWYTLSAFMTHLVKVFFLLSTSEAFLISFFFAFKIFLRLKLSVTCFSSKRFLTRPPIIIFF